MSSPRMRPPPNAAKRLLGAACIAIQPVFLNVLAFPAMAYITRTMGSTAYGQWATASSLAAITGFLTSLGLRGAFTRSVARNLESAPAAMAEQLGVRSLLAVAAGLLAVGTCAALGHPPVVFYCTAIAAGTLLIQAVVETSVDVLQAFHRFPLLAGVNLVAGILLTAASIVVVRLEMGPAALMLCYLFGAAVSALLLLAIIQWQHFPVRIRWHLGRFWCLVKESRFFAVQRAIAALSTNAEGLLVPKLVGINQYGLFYAGTLVVDRLSAVPDGIGTALYPAVAHGYTRSREAASGEVRRFLCFGLLACVPLVIATTFLAYPVAQLLFPAHVRACWLIMCITVWSLPLMTLDYIMSYSLNAVGQDGGQARQMAIAGVCNVILTVVLVAYLGLLGASLSWVIRCAVRAAVRVPSFLRTFSLGLTDFPLFRLLLCGVIMVASLRGLALAIPYIPALEPLVSAPSKWESLLALIAIRGSFGIVVYGLTLLAFGLISLSEMVQLLKRCRKRPVPAVVAPAGPSAESADGEPAVLANGPAVGHDTSEYCPQAVTAQPVNSGVVRE